MKKPLIEVKNFSVSYKDKEVLKDLNFSVYEKECFCVVGQSGGGKTTILRSLIGLKKPTQGEILVEGQNIVGLKEEELVPIRKKLAYAFQNGALFDFLTVFENLAFPLEEHSSLKPYGIKKRVNEQLKDFELEDAKDLYPSELSSGMRKKVGIARCMMLKPKVILYDEPSVNLDPYNTANLVKIMLKLKKKGTTSILVTHNMAVALKISDRIALLSEGKFAVIGARKTIEKEKNTLLKNFMEGVKGG